jgi:hypothetical protein
MADNVFLSCLIQDFLKPFKISAHSDKHSDDISLQGIGVVQMSWTFVRFHEMKIKGMLKISDFYLDKQKSFIPKKIWSVPCTTHSSFFSQQMPYCLLTLLVYMALVKVLLIKVNLCFRYYKGESKNFFFSVVVYL